MSSQPSLSARLRYKFENTLSKGPIAIIGWLGVVSLALILVAAAVLAVLNQGYGGEASFVENFWNSLMRTFDAGNMADDGAPGDGGGTNWVLRIVSLLVTLGGIFIIGSLIGALTSGLEAKLDEMRKGRTAVIESGHTLILGWSTKVFAILSELVIANENQKNPTIVILADKDKVEMEDEIKTRLPDTKNTRIVCRSGSANDLDELAIGNPHEAKSIIVLAPETNNPDISVIKSILAITNNPGRRKEPYHIVAELRSESNMEAAHLVGGEEAMIVDSSDLIARVMAQTCRQSGLSVVYTELLDFDGAEIYFAGEPSLTGKTYREVLTAYPDSSVIGIQQKDGKVLLNPAPDHKIQSGDKVIAITEDDDTMKVSATKSNPNESLIVDRAPAEVGVERTLILGWNDKAATVIKEIDHYVQSGSNVVVATMNEIPDEERADTQSALTNCSIEFIVCNTTDRRSLDRLDVAKFDHVIVLCYPDLEGEEADSITLITLLHLRNIADERGIDMNVVSEMLDIRNRALAEVARADDFIVSDKLVSLLLTQIAENRDLYTVFEQLFSDEGSEIYLKPATDYVQPGQEMDFYTVIESASRKGETAIGYRLMKDANNKDKAFGVNCCPNKAQKITFSAADRIVVLSED